MSRNAESLAAAIAAWNAGDLERYLELYDPGVTLHGYAPEPMGLAEVRSFYAGIWEAFPSPPLEILDQVEEGDRIACRFVQRGRHDGPFAGLAPTGREIELRGITILRFGGDGRVRERWASADMLGLLVQLGAVPPPGG